MNITPIEPQSTSLNEKGCRIKPNSLELVDEDEDVRQERELNESLDAIRVSNLESDDNRHMKDVLIAKEIPL